MKKKSLTKLESDVHKCKFALQIMQEVTYQFHKEDWMAFNLHHIANSPTHHKNRSKAIRSVPVMLIGLTIFYGVSEGRWIVPAIVSLVIGTIWILWYPGFRDKKVIKGIDKFIDEKQNQSFLGEHKIDVSLGGVTLTTKMSEQYVKWEDIVKLETNENYIFIYNTDTTAIILPKNALKDAASFEQMIEDNIMKAIDEK
jgi:YcxB-like protein